MRGWMALAALTAIPMAASAASAQSVTMPAILPDGRFVPLPVNLDTISQFFARDFSEEAARAFITARARHYDHPPANFAEQGRSVLGDALWSRFDRRAGRDGQLWYYRVLADRFTARLPDSLSIQNGSR